MFFGCPAYYYVENNKLNPRAKKVIFVGYVVGVKGYKVWDHSLKKVVTRASPM